MDAVPETKRKGAMRDMSLVLWNPWFFKDYVYCRPVEMELQGVIVSQNDCQFACEDEVFQIKEALRDKQDKCWRGGSICLSLSATLVPSGSHISREREDVYFDHMWADPASSVYNTYNDAGSSSSTAHIGCTPLVNTFKQQKKKKEKKNQVVSTRNTFEVCKCTLNFLYQSVLVGESDEVSCSASEIRSRHVMNGWQVVGNKNEDSGMQAKCNTLDYDTDCPVGMEIDVNGEWLLNKLPFSTLQRLSWDEMETRGLPDADAGIHKPYRDAFKIEIKRRMPEPYDSGTTSDPLNWYAESDSYPDC